MTTAAPFIFAIAILILCLVLALAELRLVHRELKLADARNEGWVRWADRMKGRVNRLIGDNKRLARKVLGEAAKE